MAASIMLRLDFTESLILDEALTHYAVDQQYRAQREADGRPRELWARLADELRHTVNRAGTPHSGKERVVALTVTGDRMHILTAALDSWARRQEKSKPPPPTTTPATWRKPPTSPEPCYCGSAA